MRSTATISLKRLIGTAVLGVACLTAVPTYANEAKAYPAGPVSLVIPFPPGGAVDQAGRAIANSLSKVWDESVVVMTKAGAGGGVGMQSVAASKPDGYTLLAAHPSMLTIPESDKLFDRKTAYDRSSFEPLALMVADPTVIVVKADSPWKTYDDFVKDAKANPGKYTYSSSGAYSALHLPIEMLSQSADMKLHHVPYKGGGPALLALLQGSVDVTAGVPGVVTPHIKSGALRALTITGEKRHQLLPDVPTSIELGYKDVEFYLWVGLFAPRDVSPDTVDAIREGVAKAVKDPAFVSIMENAGTPIDYRDGPDFKRFLDNDHARIRKAIQTIGKVD